MSRIEAKEDLWGYRKRLQFVCDSIETAFPKRPVSDIRILDVGCGSATQLGLPLALIGYELTGIDTHKPSIDTALELGNDLPNVHFVCGRVEELTAEPFDVVILSEVLEHVYDPKMLLTAGLQHMKSDGLVIVTVPNGYGEFEWDSWLFRLLGLDRLVQEYEMRRAEKKGKRETISSTENHESGHIQFFTRSRIQTIFDLCGLSIVDQNGSTLASGPFAGHALARFPKFIDWNARVTDKLPLAFSSGWFFALQRRSEGHK